MPHTLHRIATIKKGEIQDKKAKDFRTHTHTHAVAERKSNYQKRINQTNRQKWQINKRQPFDGFFKQQLAVRQRQ